jgi:hypothetical protein
MVDDRGQPGHDPEEVRALLARLSRDKRAVSAHLGIRVDLEHKTSIETRRAQASRTTFFAHDDEGLPSTAINE